MSVLETAANCEVFPCLGARCWDDETQQRGRDCMLMLLSEAGYPGEWTWDEIGRTYFHSGGPRPPQDVMDRARRLTLEHLRIPHHPSPSCICDVDEEAGS